MSFLIRPISGIKRGYNVVNSLDDKSLIITADSKDYIVKDLEVGREYFISGEIVNNIMEVSDYSEEQVLYISSQIDRAFVNYEDSITDNNGNWEMEIDFYSKPEATPIGNNNEGIRYI